MLAKKGLFCYNKIDIHCMFLGMSPTPEGVTT